MAKIYLQPGQEFSFTGRVRVGPTGSSVDNVVVDWSKVIDDNTGGVNHDEGGYVGEVTAIGTNKHYRTPTELTFYVYLEESTGRFEYDDTEGF